MEDSSGDPLPSTVKHAASISQKLREIEEGERPVAFSHVTEAAQAFLVAAIAQEIRKTFWIICPNVRSQELLYESLLNWLPDPQFLPEAEFAAAENILPDPEISAERLALLNRVTREKGPHVIIATRAALDQAAPNPAALNSAVVALRRGKREPMEHTIEALVSAGYERVAQVTTRGQFAVRGGILDAFSWQAQRPVRAEFFGDDIESLREFDIDTQTSVRNLQKIELLLGAAEDQTGTVRNYIASTDLRVGMEPDEKGDDDILIGEGWLGGDEVEDFRGAFDHAEIGDFAVGDFMLVEAKRAQFSARLKEWRTSGARVVIYFQTEGEIERFREIMGEGELESVELVEGTLPRGFVFPDGNLVVLSAAELFGRYTAHGRRRLQRAEKLNRSRAQIDFSELNDGDLVVHLEHGVGRFLGLVKMPTVSGRAPADPKSLELRP
ncbi:MAG TPA: CarD family transcriptional regulator, partial [Chthoniobacterales bacterium]|nr:CarD family transcriptional regulator [Chthoniobacterales bacterium]